MQSDYKLNLHFLNKIIVLELISISSVFVCCQLFIFILKFQFRVKLHVTDTRLIRTPHYYREFALSLWKESPHFL